MTNTIDAGKLLNDLTQQQTKRFAKFGEARRRIDAKVRQVHEDMATGRITQDAHDGWIRSNADPELATIAEQEQNEQIQLAIDVEPQIKVTHDALMSTRARLRAELAAVDEQIEQFKGGLARLGLSTEPVPRVRIKRDAAKPYEPAVVELRA
jgi:hypothetical protein